MESLFGRSFDQLQVFTGESALASVGSAAATDGSKVAFRAQAPSPSLVAHELTHVAQPSPSRGAAPIGSRTAAAEREADAVAGRVTAGEFLDSPIQPVAQRDGMLHAAPQPEFDFEGLEFISVPGIPRGLKGRELRIRILMKLGGRTWDEADRALNSKKFSWFLSHSVRWKNGYAHIDGLPPSRASLLHAGGGGSGKTDGNAGGRAGRDNQDKNTSDKTDGGNDKTETEADQATAKRAPSTAKLHIPPHLKKLLGDPAKYDQKQLGRVVAKLKQLTLQEAELFRRLARHLTKDLEVFEQSIDRFIKFRNEYKEAIEKAAGVAPKEKPLANKLDETWQGFDFSALLHV